MSTIQQIKDLNDIKRQIEAAEKGLTDLSASKRKIDEKIHASKVALNTLKAKLEQIKNEGINNVLISDHAIIRYLERVQRIDVESIRAQILTDAFIQEVQKRKGNCKYIINDGRFNIVVKNYVAITVTPKEKKQ